MLFWLESHQYSHHRTKHGFYTLIGEALVVGSSLFVVGSFFWFPILCYYLHRKYCNSWKRRFVLLGIIAYLVFVPVRPWNAVVDTQSISNTTYHSINCTCFQARRNWFWKQWSRYFNIKVNVNEDGTCNPTPSNNDVRVFDLDFQFATFYRRLCLRKN